MSDSSDINEHKTLAKTLFDKTYSENISFVKFPSSLPYGTNLYIKVETPLKFQWIEIVYGLNDAASDVALHTVMTYFKGMGHKVKFRQTAKTIIHAQPEDENLFLLFSKLNQKVDVVMEELECLKNAILFAPESEGERASKEHFDSLLNPKPVTRIMQ